MSLAKVLDKFLPNTHEAAAKRPTRRAENPHVQAHARVTMSIAIREGWVTAPKKRPRSLTSNGAARSDTVEAPPAAGSNGRSATTKKPDDAIRNPAGPEPTSARPRSRASAAKAGDRPKTALGHDSAVWHQPAQRTGLPLRV